MLTEADKAFVRAWSAVVAQGGNGMATQVIEEQSKHGVPTETWEATVRRFDRLHASGAIPVIETDHFDECPALTRGVCSCEQFMMDESEKESSDE